MNTADVLRAIPSQEESSFNEFVRDLRAEGAFDPDTDSWADLFEALDFLEQAGLVEIDRGFNNRINTLLLTPDGAAQVKEQRTAR